jgi:excisionase family DNA binding protein
MANIIRVSVSEAARLFGVSERTIRRALTAGEITYVVIRGRYKISFESLVRWSQHRPKVRNKLANDGIGQYVGQWKIKNRLYSPNPKSVQPAEEPKLELATVGDAPSGRRSGGNPKR